MKKVILAFALVACFGITGAQSVAPSVTAKTKEFMKPPVIGDVSTTANSIVDVLTSKLSLPEAQKPKLMDAISGFLTKKKDITGLADTNPKDYLSKFNPLQKGLFGKLKGIIGASAFTKFLGLKPSGYGAAENILSNLFF